MVKSKVFVPHRGDIVWLNFDPQKGHEQKGKRPAIVLSPKEYNEKVGLALFCPITSKIKDYPFEVKVDGEISGAILCDQIKSLDWRQRNAQFIMKASNQILKEVQQNIHMLLF